MINDTNSADSSQRGLRRKLLDSIVGRSGYAIGDDGSLWTTLLGHGRPTTKWRRKNTPLDRDGYPMANLWVDGKPKTFKVHRLVLLAFVGPCPHGCECLHKDGVRTNNSLPNLRWGTSKENRSDMRRHGTLMIGDCHVNSRLTKDVVRKLRSLRKPDIDVLTEISQSYGVTVEYLRCLRKPSCRYWRGA